MSDLDLVGQHTAIRTRVAIARSGQRVLRLKGEDARAAASWILPSRLHLRDAQARQSLLLDEAGAPIADVVVAADDEDYLLLVDGPIDALAHVRAHLRGDVALVDVSETHTMIEVHGPWAWELVAQALGEDVLALPYLNFFRMDECLCLRAGRTGEYGYHLIVARDAADALHARLAERGVELEAAIVGEEALALAAFENWFFDARHAPRGITPVELGLSWRLAPDRDFLGRAAVDRRRLESAPRQACVVATSAVRAGDRVVLEGRDVGEITRALDSLSSGTWIASALIDPRLVYAGITLATGTGVALRTVAPPFVDNQSLYVDPRRHTFRARDEVRFGPPALAGVTT